MEAEYLRFNNCSKREVIEEFSELFPNISITVFSQTFIIETISVLKIIMIDNYYT